MADDINETLKNIYENPEHEAGFAGIDQLYRAVKHLGITKKRVTDFLQTQSTYSVNKPLDRVFDRPRIVVSAKNQQWEADTASMIKYIKINKKFNQGYNYFAVFIDVFTRYVITVPLRTLTADEMKKTMQKIFKNEKPVKLRSDMGSEYKNKLVAAFLKSVKIEHFFSTNEVKCPFVERVIGSIKRTLEKIIKYKEKKNWVDYLASVTMAYNKRKHRIIQMSPLEARQAD